ncbi:MAG: hypothetical protein JXR14_04665 [Paracoccaceae bacterium]
MNRFATPALIALLATAGAASASTVVEGQARAILNNYAIASMPFEGPASTVVEGQAQAVVTGLAKASNANADRVQDILDDYNFDADAGALNGAQVASILAANGSGENAGIIKSRIASALR